MKSLKELCRAAAVLTAVAGLGAFAGGDYGKDAKWKEGTGGSGMEGKTAKMTVEDYTRALHHLNDLELAMAKLGKEKAKHPDVKAYSDKLQTDHAKAHEEIKQLATKRGMEFKCNDMMAMHMDMEAMDGSMTAGRGEMSEDAKMPSSEPMPGSDDPMMGTGGSGAATTAKPGENDSASQNTKAMPDDTRMKAEHHAGMGGSGPMASKDAKMDARTHAMWQEHVKVMDRLRALPADKFDREFASVMVTDHEKAIAKVQKGQAKFSDDKELKALLDKQLPVLQEHHRLALELTRKLDTGKAAGRRPMTE